MSNRFILGKISSDSVCMFPAKIVYDWTITKHISTDFMARLRSYPGDSIRPEDPTKTKSDPMSDFTGSRRIPSKNRSEPNRFSPES